MFAFLGGIFTWFCSQAVLGIRIRIHPDPKLFGLKDPDPKLLILDPDLAPDPDPPLFHTKLKISFKNVLKS